MSYLKTEDYELFIIRFSIIFQRLLKIIIRFQKTFEQTGVFNFDYSIDQTKNN